MSIPYGRQSISESDISAAVEVLKSDFLTQGPKVSEFEKSVSDYCNAKFAIATTNATSALHLACISLGVGVGDIVWTSPITFVASANCALFCGATVDFVDIDPRSYNISVEKLELKLADAEKTGKIPKVIIPVHLAGQSCEMARIHELSKRYGFKVLEDASHAIGGKYEGEPIGNCRFSDITVFSFHPVKIITTGEGGMALTNKPELADSMRLLRGHGTTTEFELMEDRPVDELWNYQQISLGYNYRMTDIQAALGISQMCRIDEFITKRQQIACRYNDELKSLAIQLPYQHVDCNSSYHLYPIRLILKSLKLSQRQIYNKLREVGVQVNLHYIPVYLHPYYQQFGFKPGYCPEAERYFKSVLTLPIFPALTEDQHSTVIDSLSKAII